MSKSVKRCRMAALAAAAVALSATSCAIGPKYVRPQTPTPTAYREAPPAGWADATPGDAEVRGQWWQMFNDAALDALEDRVNISNQNVLAAEAQYQAAPPGRSLQALAHERAPLAVDQLGPPIERELLCS